MDFSQEELDALGVLSREQLLEVAKRLIVGQYLLVNALEDLTQGFRECYGAVDEFNEYQKETIRYAENARKENE